MPRDEYVEIEEVTIAAATAKAVRLAWVDDLGECREEWAPRSCIRDGDELEKGDGPLTVELAAWKAKELDIGE